MAKILLTGFDQATQQQLSDKLNRIGYEMAIMPRTHAMGTEVNEASAVLASAEDVRCVRWLERLRHANCDVPFILIGRIGDDENWIAALEAGATDYCSADVDTGNLSWMLRNALSRGYLTSAA
jgi:DNA-binding response OmpR family regulator